MYADLGSLIFVLVVVGGFLWAVWTGINSTPDTFTEAPKDLAERDQQLSSLRKELGVHLIGGTLLAAALVWMWFGLDIAEMPLPSRLVFLLPAGMWLMGMRIPLRMRKQIRALRRYPALY